MTGLFGGTFNPPHYGHIALVRAAREHFGFDRLVVLVSVRPGHKHVELDAGTRLQLTEAAFPDDEVVLDPHERTVDLLAEGRWSDPVFLIGADQFAEFLTWKDPEGVIERARVGVATRPGYGREVLEPVLRQLSRPERIEPFAIEPVPMSSREIRDRVRRGDSIDGLVPPAVAGLIDSLGLYRNG